MYTYFVIYMKFHKKEERFMSETAKRTSHYIRTDKAIVQTFCLLLKQKSYEEITIQDILDATPISRAAFYQHFVDKEAIGEQMLSEYLQLQDDIMVQMSEQEEDQYAAIVQKSMAEHLDLVLALLKIHTPRVNLASTLADLFETQYKKRSASAEKEIEAQIYAAALTRFQIATIQEFPRKDMGSADLYNDVMIEVFLHLMKWEDKDSIRDYLHREISS